MPTFFSALIYFLQHDHENALKELNLCSNPNNLPEDRTLIARAIEARIYTERADKETKYKTLSVL